MDRWDNYSNDWYFDGTSYKRYGTNANESFTYAEDSSWVNYEVYATLSAGHNAGIAFRCTSRGNCVTASMYLDSNKVYFALW